ncbi:MAG TPA: LamG domain-containing protein [Bacteroidetes bacterium]|nr:LamG domain-containing protein [Bacteroidota bacterium]
MKKLIFLLFLFLLTISCQNQIQEPIEQPVIEGKLNLKLDLDNAPSEVVQLNGILRNETDTLIFDFQIKDGYAEALVENIASGLWELQVDALDENGKIIYTGKTEVFVNPGEITPVYLHLNPVTGSLQIIVTWGNTLPMIIAYFPFNGDLKDRSRLQNDAIGYGDIKFSDGVFGDAIEFDGDSDFVQIPHIDAYNQDEKTITFWFKKTNEYIEDTPGWDDVEGLVFKSYNTDKFRDFSFLIGQQTPPFRFVFNVYNYGDSLIFLREYEVIEPNNWYHVAGVITSNTAKLYLNGELVNVKEFSGVLYHNDAPITVGSVPPADRMIYRYFKGKIDELAIFSQALSQEEIQMIYKYGISN